MDIGKRVREYRKSKGLLMQHVAAQSGINYKKLSRLELGIQKMDVSDLEAIAKALGVSLNIFFDDYVLEAKTGCKQKEAS